MLFWSPEPDLGSLLAVGRWGVPTGVRDGCSARGHLLVKHLLFLPTEHLLARQLPDPILHRGGSSKITFPSTHGRRA